MASGKAEHAQRCTKSVNIGSKATENSPCIIVTDIVMILNVFFTLILFTQINNKLIGMFLETDESWSQSGSVLAHVKIWGYRYT